MPIANGPDGKRDRSPLASAEFAELWVRAATEIGWTIARTEDAYATSDGRRTISVAADHLLDTDDALAQLIFHELCHGIVQGPDGWSEPDWGLSNFDDQDVVREHACLRVQIALAEPFGLRSLLAPTTEYRGYHDAVVGDPLDPGDAAGRVAGEALGRPAAQPWIRAITAALAATRKRLVGAALASLPPPLHPAGFALGPSDRTCGQCAWIYVGGRGRGVSRCRQSAIGDAAGARTHADQRACIRWEPPVSCQSCGACCREAYHSVTVAVRDPVVWKRPELIVRHGQRFEIRREGDRCAALDDRRGRRLLPVISGDGSPLFSCAIYEDRPRPCREFEAGGRHCLVARRRVGLSVDNRT